MEWGAISCEMLAQFFLQVNDSLHVALIQSLTKVNASSSDRLCLEEPAQMT